MTQHSTNADYIEGTANYRRKRPYHGLVPTRSGTSTTRAHQYQFAGTAVYELESKISRQKMSTQLHDIEFNTRKENIYPQSFYTPILQKQTTGDRLLTPACGDNWWQVPMTRLKWARHRYGDRSRNEAKYMTSATLSITTKTTPV